MAAALEVSFNNVIRVKEQELEEMGQLSMDVKLSLFAWKACLCKKAVFLQPNSSVLGNCDKLFNIEGDFNAVPIRIVTAESTHCFNTSVFVFKPSAKIFTGIIAFLKVIADKNIGTGMDTRKLTLSQVLRLYFGARLNNECEVQASSQIDEFANETLALLKVDCSATGDTEEKYCVDEIPGTSSLSEPIAIVGLSCRFPDANNENEFWDLLYEGRDATRFIPGSRLFTRRAFMSDDDLQDVPAGYLKCPIDEFDARFFHISRREAEYMDPQQRLLLEVSWESLENAGINPQSLKDSNAAVFMGIWAQEYAMCLDRDFQAENFHFRYLGNALCAASARISHFLGCRGPSITMEAGCASALQAVHYACESLRHGTSDLAISGGVNVALNSGQTVAGFDSFILSKDGKCKTFDKDANGFARGEACAVLILKRLSDAMKDKNEILGLIRGSAVNSDGAGSSLGTPNAVAQEQAVRAALRNAGVQPHEISYVEAHGTGTPVGDPLEFHSLNCVFGDDLHRTQPLLVGSVKTNIGHTEGASGVSGLVKVLLAMKYRTIPRHMNFTEINPYIDLNKIPAVIPQESTAWVPCSSRGLLAGLSSFGLSGTNVHMIIQEAPKQKEKSRSSKYSDRNNHVLVLSASSEEARADLVDRYIALLGSNSEVSLDDLAYSANTGRAHLSYRLALIAEDSGQALSRLQKGQFQAGKVSSFDHKVAFLFTGQGSQYLTMAKELYDTHPFFKFRFDQCNDLLRKYSPDLDLKLVLSYSTISKKYNLDDSMYSQPSIFCIEYCLAELWHSFGIFPHYVLGHSVGEFAAAVVAGVISFEDGLKLVAERSRLVSSMPKGSMVVVRVSVDRVKKFISEFERENSEFWADVAASNSSDEVVLSGLPEPIAAFQEFCKSKYGINTQKLNASHAFHSRAMDPVLKEYEQIASTVKYGTSLKCQFISGALAKEILLGQFDSKYWVSHFRESVNFVDAFGLLRKEKCDVFVEIGAQPVLLGLGMALSSMDASSVCTWCPSIRKTESNWITMLTSLCRMYTAGVDVDWVGFDSAYHRTRIPLPNYPFQREKYWFCSESKTVESLSVNSKLLHPLLGRRIPSPKTELISYYSSINLSRIPYMRDHKVENVVLVPAAGYLEIILAAGSDIIGGGFNSPIPLTVEGLMIEAALVLTEECPTQLQTTMNMMTEEDGQIKYLVSVHKQTLFDVSGSDTGKWRKMVSASFIPTASIGEFDTTSINLFALKESLTQRPTVDDIYTKIAETGINFGPLFKSIHGVWYSETEILVETSLPESSDKYVCHPIVLDAMIQCSVATLAMNPGAISGLHLPIAIRKFAILPKVWTLKLYMLIRRDSDTNTKSMKCVTLYNENGEFMAVMEGLELIDTTVDSFLKSVQSDEDIYPTFYDETWHWQSSTNSNRVDVNAKHLNEDIITQILEAETKRFESLSGLSTEDQNLMMTKADELSYLYILKCLREMGWSEDDIPGTDVSIDKLKKEASVAPEHHNLFRRWMQILAEEGDVEFLDEENVRVLRSIPNTDEVDLRIQDCISHFHGDARAFDCQYIINFGEHLAELIQGKMSPFSLLFPESKDKVGASAFYNFGAVMSTVHKALSLAFSRILGEHLVPNKNEVLRLLEIGGGSGSLTAKIVKELDELGIRYEYTFTDISPLLLQMAKVRFSENKNMKFQLLDIEIDPKRQGFAPHSFDIVFADNVLHATQDLRRSLMNVRHLIIPKGILMLVEIVNRARLMDISFGFTNGWWRFTDFDIRKDYPSVDKETWTNLLTAHGFQTPTSMIGQAKTGQGGQISLDALVASVDDQPCLPPGLDEAKAVWLVFGGVDHKATQCLKSKLESSGMSVILAHVSQDFYFNQEESQWGVRVHHSDDYCQLLQSLGKQGLTLGGVLHLWGMITEAKPNWEHCPDKLHPETMLSELTNGLLYLAQAMSSTNCTSNIFLVTVGMQAINDSEYISKNPVSQILNGMMSTMNNELLGHQFVCIDLQRECEFQDDLMISACKDVFDQLWLQDEELQIAFRNGNKYVKRMTFHEPYRQSLALPNAERYRLVNPGTGNFSDFSIVPCAKLDLEKDQVEVRVKCTALNFKDVLVALNTKDMSGFLPTDKKHTSTLPDYVTELGLDFAGTVTRVGIAVSSDYKVGDNVFGMTTGDYGGSLASHVVVPQTSIRHIKPGMSFEDSSAIGIVLFTVHHFLIERANIRKGDKVLIHCASGGVGLFAIQVAQYFGAEVFATAGSDRKRNYVRDFMNVSHVYNSRDTSFGSEIFNDTNGYGVDIVLNALTGPGFKEASLSVCAPKARFLEMSKLNIWTVDEMYALRPDIMYAVQDVSQLQEASQLMSTFGDPEQIFKFWDDFYASGKFKRLPCSRFTLGRVHDAFRYLQKAKHIGKVLVKIPATTVRNGKIVHMENLFNEFGSFLITGGLGGIGLEVTKWMASSGAKYLVLAGRSPPTPKAESILGSLRDTGIDIIVSQVDVSDMDGCIRMLESIKQAGYPPLKGIMHAAGVLANDEIKNLTTESFLKTFRPKIQGAWNLHTLTLDCNLDHFVLFSSLVTTVGGIGQANHSAANRYLNAFAAYRTNLGLPCTSVGWGAWSEVGAAAGMCSAMERVFGLKSFTPAQGVACLQRILLEHRQLTLVSDITDWNILTQTCRQGKLFELVKTQTKSVRTSAEYDRRIKIIKEASPENRLGLIKEFLEYIVRDTLKLSDSEVIDHDADLKELGIDSLMAMEIKTKLQDLLKDVDQKSLSVQTFSESRTINKLAALVTAAMNGELVLKPLTPEELLQLVQKDSKLPDDISIDRTNPVTRPSKFSHILLTGAAGQLGAYIVHDLTTRRPDLVVYCLIRAESDALARDKLEAKLNSFDLFKSTCMDNVVCIAGSVSREQFGLTPELYTELTMKVDAVIHCAAMMNHLLPYGEFGPDDLRSTNVLGLLNVLKFSVAGKIKPIQHESFLGILSEDETSSVNTEPMEQFPADDNWGQEFFQSGYLTTKFVCEKLLKEAVFERQLPVTVVRHCHLTGDSKTGLMTTRADHVLMFILASRRVKTFPEYESHISMVPIDVSARISVSLFLHDETEAGIYTIVNPITTQITEVAEMFKKKGHEYRLVPFTEWRETVILSQKTELAAFAEIYMKGTIDSPELTKNPILKRMKEDGRLVNSNKLKRYVPEIDELMPNPLDLINLYVNKYEAEFPSE